MYNQEDDKIVEMQDFSNKKTESEGETVDRNAIFEPRPDEDCKKEESIKETREPKEILISEINDLQMTLKDLMEKVENVNGDVKRLEIENEVNVLKLNLFAWNWTNSVFFSKIEKCSSKLQVLSDYIRNMMETCEVFEPTDF